MNNEFERKWKEAVVAQFKVPSRHLSGGTEEKHENPQDSRSADRNFEFHMRGLVRHVSAY
jgi:hypothetical protein